MPRLEYRLLDDAGRYPVLYYYQDIDETEIAARFVCDYFVKENILYEKQSCSLEPLVYVIYVKKISQEITVLPDDAQQPKENIRVEVRHFREYVTECPLVFTYELRENKEVMLYLQSDYFIWGGQEWQKTSAEIDEDRKVYVIYAQPGEMEE